MAVLWFIYNPFIWNVFSFLKSFLGFLLLILNRWIILQAYYFSTLFLNLKAMFIAFRISYHISLFSRSSDYHSTFISNAVYNTWKVTRIFVSEDDVADHSRSINDLCSTTRKSGETERILFPKDDKTLRTIKPKSIWEEWSNFPEWSNDN